MLLVLICIAIHTTDVGPYSTYIVVVEFIFIQPTTLLHNYTIFVFCSPLLLYMYYIDHLLLTYFINMIKTFGKLSIFAEYYSNSYSRGHRAVLQTPCCTYTDKIRYYNRTRECFTYQSVLCKVFEQFIENCSRRELEFYKDDIAKLRKYLKTGE